MLLQKYLTFQVLLANFGDLEKPCCLKGLGEKPFREKFSGDRDRDTQRHHDVCECTHKTNHTSKCPQGGSFGLVFARFCLPLLF